MSDLLLDWTKCCCFHNYPNIMFKLLILATLCFALNALNSESKAIHSEGDDVVDSLPTVIQPDGPSNAEHVSLDNLRSLVSIVKSLPPMAAPYLYSGMVPHSDNKRVSSTGSSFAAWTGKRSPHSNEKRFTAWSGKRGDKSFKSWNGKRAGNDDFDYLLV